MKKNSLFLKFILAYLIFGLLCFAFVALVASQMAYRRCLRNKADELYDQAVNIADAYSDVYKDGTIPENFRTQLTGICEYSRLRIWFLDNDGTISFDTGDLTGSVVSDFDRTDFTRAYLTGDFYGMLPEPMLSVLAPVTANFETKGYVIIFTPLSDLEALSDLMLIPLYLTVLALFVLSLGLLVLIRRLILRPVRAITKGADEYAAGNLKYTIPTDTNDEMGYLANTLNLMAHKLSTAEDYQKKFIANVSHDFRSPLTSIKGYLEAIADGVIPPENQEKYIRIVINETERLNNLTQSMLSLNSLDRSSLHLEYSDFDINRLVKNVCATFERTCSVRDISFDLILSDEKILVHADMGKIQQVVYNLVDNAIKFSNDGSAICITISQRKDAVFVSVKDTGIGIAKKNLQQIWTRFFKTDESRGKDKRGTGLGLSIVKEIIQAHGETIDVISTEGAGTEFIFRLQRGASTSEADAVHPSL